MPERTLWIHAGGTKTGSSALQNFFDRHSSQLESLDFAYKNRVRATGDFEISSGNGLWLCDALTAGLRENQIDEIVRGYFGECSNAICSSEYFTILNQFAWRELFRSSLRVGVELKVIFYVRNAIPVLVSDYDQAVKMHGEARSFSDWILTADWPHFRALKLIADEIPTSNILALSYDHNKSHLLRSFLTALALDTRVKFEPDEERRRVNRSLTNDERDILLLVNRSTGASFCKELSGRLIDADPTAAGEPVSIPISTKGYLLERFGSEATWLNKTFFEGKPLVSVLPLGTDDGAELCSDDPDIPVSDDAQRIALKWAINKLSTINAEATIRLLRAVTGAAVTQSEMRRLVPVDFDPIAYLSLNPDLVGAGVDPYRHFVDHGREEGRPFKFEDLDDTRSHQVDALNRRILVLEELLKQTAIVAKDALRRADVSKREASDKLALELLRKRSGLFSRWFRGSKISRTEQR